MTEHKSKKPHSDNSKKEDENMPSQRFEDDNLIGSRIISEDAGLPSPDNKSELHDQIDTLNKALAETQDKMGQYWERLLRKEAELQNLQKRMQDEVEKTRKFAIDRFASEILQVLDSLEQGLNFAQSGNVTTETLMEGMKLTQSVLMNSLDKQGISVINPEGEVFNPTFHEAISVQETNHVPPNKVLVVVQKGYMLNNRLLRPARVVVSKAPA
ncbi:MAG: nucleotide exchange factor GrpE [Gammaproteobacteria bacterium]|jgi:molecular chaperone GrpE|nr:nucleotide exchange factor GrpE [Gammaproteobacteria bacterium]